MDVRGRLAKLNDPIVKNYDLLTSKLKISELLISHLIKEECLSDSEIEYMRASEIKKSQKVAKLLEIIERKHALAEFHKGLIGAGEYSLAEALKKELYLLPSVDDVCGSASGFFGIKVHSPSQKSVQENQQFYEAEIKAFHDTQQTRGIMEDLSVDMADIAFRSVVYDSNRVYRNFSNPKGLALVINNRDFAPSGGLPNRLGTDVDCVNISRLLFGLGYKVKIQENMTSQDMISYMQKFARKDEHRKCDSTVIVILSHGRNGRIYGVDCRDVPLAHLEDPLKPARCAALAGKPKIFIIQACRGEKYDLGIDLTDSAGEDDCEGNVVKKLVTKMVKLDVADAQVIKKIPMEADTLHAYATTPGYVSWRNSVHGSWFIQSICEVFSRNAKKSSITDMLIEVSGLVAKRISSSLHVQSTEFACKLQKEFYFFPGVDDDLNIN